MERTRRDQEQSSQNDRAEQDHRSPPPAATIRFVGRALGRDFGGWALRGQTNRHPFAGPYTFVGCKLGRRSCFAICHTICLVSHSVGAVFNRTSVV